MKYNNIYLDFDGVFVDSEERIIKYKEMHQDISWEEFFEQLNWFEFLDECTEINDTIKIVQELQDKTTKIAVLTKIHTLLEMQAKVKFLREKKKITVPIYFVPPHVKKSQIIIPTNNDLLIDDSQKNIDDWIAHGGIGIQFCEDLGEKEKTRTKSLKFLLQEEL